MNSAAIAWLGRQIAWEARLTELRRGLSVHVEPAPVPQAA